MNKYSQVLATVRRVRTNPYEQGVYHISARGLTTEGWLQRLTSDDMGFGEKIHGGVSTTICRQEIIANLKELAPIVDIVESENKYSQVLATVKRVRTNPYGHGIYHVRAVGLTLEGRLQRLTSDDMSFGRKIHDGVSATIYHQQIIENLKELAPIVDIVEG